MNINDRATADAPAADHASLGDIARVRKAYEQVHDELRRVILHGHLRAGDRLPNEAQVAVQFGVSRSTVREALRLLVAEGLVRTVKGSGGGSFVSLPTVDYIAGFLERNFELLSQTDGVSLGEFLEARELLEVFAVRRVAQLARPEDLKALRETILEPDSELSPHEQYLHNREFHARLVDACGNALLHVAAQPIFFVLHTHLTRSSLPPDFAHNVCAEHRQILEAIESGDADRAEARMRQHLVDLGATYAEIWRDAPAGAVEGVSASS